MNRSMMAAFALSATPFLTGCAAVELAHLAGQVGAQEISTKARAENDVLIQKDVKVYSAKMFQQRPWGVTPCKYSGVIVEYARDWDEKDNEGRVIRKAEPDKKAGYALILNKEVCPNKEPVDIFKVGDSYAGGSVIGVTFVTPKYVIREGNSRLAVNYLEMNPEFRPKWMQQVIKTIKSEAQSNPGAAAFLSQMQGRTDTNLFK